MGLDSAFIVINGDEYRSYGDKPIAKVVWEGRSERVLHGAIMRTTGADRDEKKPRIQTVNEQGYEGHADYYVELDKGHVARLFGVVHVDISPDSFSIRDYNEFSRFLLVSKLLIEYHPGRGDRLIYAWSD